MGFDSERFKLDDALSEIYMLRKSNSEIFKRLNELEKKMAQVTAIALAIAVVIPVIVESILKK
jgi:hypothetical protein|tara:strand:+ start:1184 stop:1372 length:189 start_codon:yes stop_codon:yes gene_type:complete